MLRVVVKSRTKFIEVKWLNAKKLHDYATRDRMKF